MSGDREMVLRQTGVFGFIFPGNGSSVILDPARADGMPYQSLTEWERKLLRVYLEGVLDRLAEADGG